MRSAQCGFDSAGGVAPSENETKVAVPFGEGSDCIVKRGRNFNRFDTRYGERLVHPIVPAQKAVAGNGDHHNAAGAAFPPVIRYR